MLSINNYSQSARLNISEYMLEFYYAYLSNKTTMNKVSAKALKLYI